jgi:hypothetical protein
VRGNEVVVTQVANAPWDGYRQRLYVRPKGSTTWSEYFLDDDASFGYWARITLVDEGAMAVSVNGSRRMLLDSTLSHASLIRDSGEREMLEAIRQVESPIFPDGRPVTEKPK